MRKTSEHRRLVLIDDDGPFRGYLAALLNSTETCEVVASCGNLAEGRAAVEREQPDLALLDVELPDGFGSQAIESMRRLAPNLRVLMLTAHDEESILVESIRQGACGYLTKGISSDEVLRAIEEALTGGAPMSPAIARKVMALVRERGLARTSENPVEPNLPPLTPRESEIMEWVVEGLLDKEIASRLGVAVSTVKNQLANVYVKWRVRSRTEAAVRFLRQDRAD